MKKRNIYIYIFIWVCVTVLLQPHKFASLKVIYGGDGWIFHLILSNKNIVTSPHRCRGHFTKASRRSSLWEVVAGTRTPSEGKVREGSRQVEISRLLSPIYILRRRRLPTLGFIRANFNFLQSRSCTVLCRLMKVGKLDFVEKFTIDGKILNVTTLSIIPNRPSLVILKDKIVELNSFELICETAFIMT